ncbi:MAG: hypothetical protein K8U57_04290 [Planctomycetes bacterium]|nr:hypothetical protein [Planctomycetota bacterium]
MRQTATRWNTARFASKRSSNSRSRSPTERLSNASPQSAPHRDHTRAADQKPSVVVIYIGINDVWHGLSDPSKGTSKEKFEEGLKDIIGKIKDGGARVILCTPTVIGEKKAGGNKADAQLDEYAEISRKVAKDTGSKLCDLRKAFVDHLAKNNADDKDKGVLTSDTVHLNEAGNKLVAETILAVLDK